MRRLLSLDVFRGITIASMIMVNNPGSWEHVFPPLRHADWHGWTFTDLVFPFFLWMVGVSMTLSFARRVEQGADRVKLFIHSARRGLTIAGLGLFLNAVPSFDLAHLRFPGVLQRIGVCYLVASAIYLMTSQRGQQLAIAALLVLYAVLMAPGGYAKDSNFARTIDSTFLSGHMWSSTKVWDPEGIISTIPAVATCLFGCLAGHLIRSRQGIADKASWLFFWGVLLIAAGLMLDPFMPINKNLWTSSFAVFMAGMASVCLASFYWLCDGVGGFDRWFEPFKIYGMNAIALYVLSGLLARVLALSGVKTWLWTNVYAALFADARLGSLLFALSEVLLLYLVALILYRKKIFIRL